MSHELWRLGGLSWVTIVCAIGYPPYFMLRRWMGFDAFSGFFFRNAGDGAGSNLFNPQLSASADF